jgi:hypothetical protein
MKRAPYRLLLAIAGLASNQTLGQTSDKYDLHWNVTGVGASTMSGNPYTLNGSIGQGDTNLTGKATGAGGYSLSGGFWNGVALNSSDVIFRNGFDLQ